MAGVLEVRIATRVCDTEAEGPGRRWALWVQGCPLRCPGCCNPELLPLRARDGSDKLATVDELAREALATLMAEVGPQTIVAVSLDPADWVLLSCDPGRPCPPRKPGPDKMGKRVIDVMQRACSKPTTLWFPEKKGCPAQ